jgi:hypothetical protein
MGMMEKPNQRNEGQQVLLDVDQDENHLIEPDRSYPVWSPDIAFGAAAALLQALENG